MSQLGGAKQRFLLYATTVLLGAPVTAQPAAPLQVPPRESVASAAPEIDQMVEAQADAGLFSGLILVAKGEQVLFERGYGYSNWELRTPNSPSTRFGIASITKALTEALVRVLEGKGRIELDAPVEEYLPGFPTGLGGTRPTVRQLLTHRAGVPHRVTSPSEEGQYLDAADVVERVKAAGLLFEPGSKRLYSSAGYTCLARIVEVVEGRPFQEVLADLVLKPAGMTGAMSETGPRLMPNRALPYRLGADAGQIVVKNAPYKDLRFLTGAGSVYATGRDLVAFVNALEEGQFGDSMRIAVFGGQSDEWQTFAGRTNGYEAWVDMRPRTDVILVFLSNLQSASNWELREQIHNVLVHASPDPVPLPPSVAPVFEDPQSVLGSFGPAEITYVDGALFRGDNEFYPIVGERYYIPASGTRMYFRRGAEGDVDALVSIGADGRESIFPRERTVPR